MPKRKDNEMTDPLEVDIDPNLDPDPQVDNYSTTDHDPDVEPEAPKVAHSPDLIQDFDRYDYIAVDGQTLVAEFKFDDSSGIKAWTRDQGKSYTTRRISKFGQALLLSGQSRASASDVNAEIEAIAAELEANND